MAAAAHRGARFAERRVADRRRGARDRRLRGEVQRHAFDIELAQLAQHRLHRRRCAPTGEILLRRGNEINRLLAGEVRRAGGLAVAVVAMAGHALRGDCLAMLIRREDRLFLGRYRLQAGVEGSDTASLIVAQISSDRAQGGVNASAFLVFLQRRYDVAPALPGEIGNAGSDALAVEAVTALAFPLRYAPADADVFRGLLVGPAALVRTADQRHRQEHGEQQMSHGKPRIVMCWLRLHRIIPRRRGDG